MRFIVLAFLFLAAVCFAQTDSSNCPNYPTYTTHPKPVDTTLDNSGIFKPFTIKKNKELKVKCYGNGIDTIFLRIFSANPFPLNGSGDTLKCDSIQILITARVVKWYGLRNKSGPLR